MLAALMAGGVGVTAIGATVATQDGSAAPPLAAEEAPVKAEPAAAPAQPVLLDRSIAATGSLVEPAESASITIVRESAASSEAPAATPIVIEPVQATVLGPYDPTAAPAPVEADPQFAAGESEVEPVAEPAAELAEHSSDATTPDIALAASGIAPGLDPAPVTVEPMQADGPAATVDPVEAELLPAKPALADTQETANEVQVAETPASPPDAAAPTELAVVPADEPAPAELPATELAAVPETAEDPIEALANEPEPAVELAADDALRAAEPVGQGSAFALAFADLAVPQPEPAIAPTPEPIAVPAAEVSELAPAAAPAPPIANMAFDLAALPQATPAEPGSAFARPDDAAATAQTARTAARGHGAPGSRYRLTGNGIEFRIPAVLFGEELGTVPLRIGSTNLVSVRLGDLLALVAGRMDPAAHDRLAGSRNAEEYVSFSALRDAGIDVRYDAANDRLILAE